MGRRRTAEAKPVESDVGLEQPTGGESAAAPRDDAPPPPSQGFGDGEDTLQDGDGVSVPLEPRFSHRVCLCQCTLFPRQAS